MSTISSTAQDLITGALRNINVLEAAETPSASDSADALQVLNDLLESWSIDHLNVYSVVENILTFTPGQYQYTIGNPVGGTFTGTVTSGSPTITGVTVPTNMIVGGTLTDVQAAIPSGTTITAIGTNTITMSANALSTPGAPETITYTVPGNFNIARPLRITNSFTRITASGTSGLDYPIDFEGGRDKYTAIGLKGLQGPWPIVGWYNPTYPYGNVYFYPNPSSAGQLHLFTDTIFTDFTTLTQSIALPQGYARALKKNLAIELAPEYGASVSPTLQRQADESLKMIKSLNSTPAVQAFYDTDIVRSRRNDAGWILSGGFI
jgi:hypothetical protein